MALMSARRHVTRYVIAALVFLLLCYQFLFRAASTDRLSGQRHLKDPVQELKDNGVYVPVHKEPLTKQPWPDTAGNKGGKTGTKQVGLKDAQDELGESADKLGLGSKGIALSATATKVDDEVLSKLMSVESERTSTDLMFWTTYTTSPKGYHTSTPTDTRHAVYANAPATPSPTPATHKKKPYPSPTRPHMTQSPSLQRSAHALPSADDFLPHFAALQSQENITVSEAMESCAWAEDAPVNFQFGKDAEWAVNLKNETDISIHREKWQRFVLEEAMPWSAVADRFSGRGIVIVAGNERSLKRTFVLLRMLKHFKIDLPVEVHHHGSEELSSQNKTDLRSVFPDMSFSDLEHEDQPVTTTAMGFINYNLKTAALLNSKFAEPLLLDSDNLPVSDPAVLYKSKTYMEYGTVFWPDIARTRPENPIWALTNTPCTMDEYEQESGQLLVDKRRFWYHLQLAKYWSDSEYYNSFLLGDKDTFRFAWRALRTEYGRPRRWLTSVGVVQRPRDERAFPSEPEVKSGIGSTSAMSKDRDENGNEGSERQGRGVYCGHSFGQHFPDTKESPILFLHGGLVKTLAPAQIQHARKYGRGIFAAYKDSPMAANWSEVEKVRIKWDGGAYLESEERASVKGAAHCTDMEEVVPGVAGDEVTEELDGFEEVAEKAGVYWMVGPDDDGTSK